MSGYSAVSATGRVTVGETDTIWTPRSPRAGTCGVILVHGSGAPKQFTDVVQQPSSVTLAATIAGTGIPCIAAEFGGDAWANNTCMTGIDAAWTTLKAAFPLMRTDKVCLVGVSMGGGAVARWSQLHPTSTAAAVGIIPAFNLKYEYDNIPGVVAAIEAAWGFTGSGNYPAAADTLANASAASGVPIKAFYSSNDTTVPSAGITQYINAVGASPASDMVDVGALGHTDAAVGAVNTTTLIRFLADNGA